jgi:hypothetical protein
MNYDVHVYFFWHVTIYACHIIASNDLWIFFLFSKLGLDLIPRVGPLAVNPIEVGIVSLHNFHSSSDENTKNTSVSFYFNK